MQGYVPASSSATNDIQKRNGDDSVPKEILRDSFKTVLAQDPVRGLRLCQVTEKLRDKYQFPRECHGKKHDTLENPQTLESRQHAWLEQAFLTGALNPRTGTAWL
jgi:hypothetical protein